jgi:hypothetical protein
MLNGQLHREDGPAIINTNGDKLWYLNDLLHREDGPAIERVNESKHWFLHGECHRADGPATEYKDHTRYYLYNKLHRTDGPAVEWSNNSNSYQVWYFLMSGLTDYKDIEYPVEGKRWYLEDKEYTEEEYWRMLKLQALW